MWHSLSVGGSHQKPTPIMDHTTLCSSTIKMQDWLCPRRVHLHNPSKDLTRKIRKLYVGRQGDDYLRCSQMNEESGGLRKAFPLNTVKSWPLSKTKLMTASQVAHMEMSELMEELSQETDKAFGSGDNATAAGVREAGTEKPKIYHSSNGNEYLDKISSDKDTQSACIPLESGAGNSPAAIKATDEAQKTEMKKVVKLLGRQKDTNHGTRRSRWAKTAIRDVTNNVAGVLSGKVFKLEVDEMPNRKPLQPPPELAEKKRSFESTASTQTAGRTPIDPFHFEDLICRMKAAENDPRNYKTETVVADSMPEDQSISRLQGKLNSQTGPCSSKSTSFSKFEKSNDTIPDTVDFAIISPKVPKIKRKKKLRHRLTLSRDRILRSIPEAQTAELSPISFLGSRKVESPYLSIIQQKNFITLPSTAFTLTAPLFRHGPIRIDRTDSTCSPFSPQDEFMDWTAFQMAILGTMDANGGDPRDDWEWEANEQALEEVVLWWESFGFEGFGALESSSSDNLADHIEKLPISNAETYRFVPDENAKRQTDVIESHSQLQRTCRSSPKLSFGMNVDFPCETYKPWTASYAASIPPSPMFSLATHSRGEGDAKVRMGYNLGHDLDDFLRWEPKHVQLLIDQ